MNCSKCGFKVDEKDKTCKMCGAGLENEAKKYEECEKCGYRLKDSEEVCKICGHHKGDKLFEFKEVELKKEEEVKEEKDSLTLNGKVEKKEIFEPKADSKTKNLTMKDLEKLVIPTKEQIKPTRKTKKVVTKKSLDNEVVPFLYGIITIALSYFTKGLILPLAILGIIESKKRKSNGLGMTFSVFGIVIAASFLLLNIVGMVDGFLKVTYHNQENTISFKADRIWERKKDIANPEIRLIYDKNKGSLDYLKLADVHFAESLHLPAGRQLLHNTFANNFEPLKNEVFGKSSQDLILLDEKKDSYYGYIPYRSNITKGRYYFYVDVKHKKYAIFKSYMPINLDNMLFDDIEDSILEILKSIEIKSDY